MNTKSFLNAFLLLAISLGFSTGYVYSHPGGLDKNGGHTQKSTGQYHCHRDSCIAATVKDQESKSQYQGYSREDWPHWSVGSDGINMRHRMLRDTSVGPVVMSPDGKYVSKGKWVDPFSGKTFTRPSDLDIDHVVPLSYAHHHGAAQWSTAMKERFANDPVNLLVVDDGLNQSKSDSGPTEWMPPNHQYRCEYLNRWVVVFDKYPDLKMTASEQRTFNRMLQVCS